MRTPMLALILAGLAFPALASERCEAPQADWRPIEELTADLTANGWTVSNVKTEDGCYEVYGRDETGARVETFFDPATFEAVGSED
ncbi:MAG: PepSY domain-containing protein [Paracoccus hibiscisoli]|uniref:PepSY domain-containing protein n=1 Tax=Paracoccus hibiscisoli TaxID=2023261 RepID=UPI00391DABC2